MRLSIRHFTAASFAVLALTALVGCQSSGLPLPPNGPSNQFFSTNNALIRFVDGSPNAGPLGCTPGTNTCTVDVFIDGSPIRPPVGLFNPSANPINATIASYYSFPSGQALLQVFQHGTTNLVFEGAFNVSANKKYSLVLAGQGPALPPPAPPFWPVFQFTDGAFLTGVGGSQINFHNASVNGGTTQFQVTCSACASPQKFGNPAAAGASTVGPNNLTPSGNYSLQGTNGTLKAITPSQLEGKNTGNVLPDPYAAAQPNVSVYSVDTTGVGSTLYELIGTIDNNG